MNSHSKDASAVVFIQLEFVVYIRVIIMSVVHACNSVPLYPGTQHQAQTRWCIYHAPLFNFSILNPTLSLDMLYGLFKSS